MMTSHRSPGSPVPGWEHSMWLGRDKAGARGKQQGHTSAMAGTGMFGE